MYVEDFYNHKNKIMDVCEDYLTVQRTFVLLFQLTNVNFQTPMSITPIIGNLVPSTGLYGLLYRNDILDLMQYTYI